MILREYFQKRWLPVMYFLSKEEKKPCITVIKIQWFWASDLFMRICSFMLWLEMFVKIQIVFLLLKNNSVMNDSLWKCRPNRNCKVRLLNIKWHCMNKGKIAWSRTQFYFKTRPSINQTCCHFVQVNMHFVGWERGILWNH